MMTLYSVKAWGGVIPQLMLAMSSLPHEVVYLTEDELRSAPAFGDLNPLRQVPTLKLEDGSILTESLAICTYLDEHAALGLVPPAGSPHRAGYLRWSTFLVASIYPTFTFGDVPSRWVSGKAAQDQLRTTSDKFREEMWRQVEGAAAPDGPWFLGQKQSLIDLYLAVMTMWRPRWEWFETQTPRLAAVAERVRGTEVFERVFKANE